MPDEISKLHKELRGELVRLDTDVESHTWDKPARDNGLNLSTMFRDEVEKAVSDMKQCNLVGALESYSEMKDFQRLLARAGVMPERFQAIEGLLQKVIWEEAARNCGCRLNTKQSEEVSFEQN